MPCCIDFEHSLDSIHFSFFKRILSLAGGSFGLLPDRSICARATRAGLQQSIRTKVIYIFWFFFHLTLSQSFVRAQFCLEFLFCALTLVIILYYIFLVWCAYWGRGTLQLKFLQINVTFSCYSLLILLDRLWILLAGMFEISLTLQGDIGIVVLLILCCTKLISELRSCAGLAPYVRWHFHNGCGISQAVHGSEPASSGRFFFR